MHIPDGFLNPVVCIIGYGVTAIFWFFAFKKAERVLDDRQIPLMAILTAMFFAVQMMNYPIVGGTTAHLIGGPILAITVGPYAGVISMTIILLIQALVFRDGGLTTLGCNVWNMGIIAVFTPYLLCLASTKLMKNNKGLFTGAFVGAVVGSVSAAVFAGLELGVSVTFPYSIQIATLAMASHHVIIGVGEGIATLTILSVLSKSRPDLLQLPRIAPSWMGRLSYTPQQK